MRRPFWSCWRIRRVSVFVPRSTSQQSNGPGTAPTAFWRNANFSARSSRRVTAMPPTMSEWPFRYLVVEWTTMSAPNSNGRWKTGVAKVLSTAKSTLRAAARDPRAPRSARRIIGFVGVSTNRSLVAGLIARSTIATSLVSTKLKVRPMRERSCSIRRWVPPYTFSPQTTWSPEARSERHESIAAIPEANAKPCVPPSSDATFRSSASRVGLLTRAYSWPLCLPSASWTYVEVWKIGIVTAPASGSGSCPACTARVPSPWSVSSSRIRVIECPNRWMRRTLHRARRPSKRRARFFASPRGFRAPGAG